MSPYSIHLALLRKEFRQLAPLLISVLLLCIGGFAMFGLLPLHMRATTLPRGYILLLIPALFSVGAGAMSISQEKETRTLGWLSSLPLSKERLIATKFVAALLAWVGLWLSVVLITLVIDSLGFGPVSYSVLYDDPESHPIYSSWFLYWIVHSFYLLVIGFLTAWRLGSSMTALVAIVPLAIAPSVLRFIFAYARNPGHDFGAAQYDGTLGESLAVIACILFPALWLMNRFAVTALSPQQIKQPQNPYAATDLATDTTKQSSQTVLSPSSAMLWQFFRQNQTLFLGLCGISFAVALPVLLFADTAHQTRRFPWELLAVITVFTITAWMGVLVFQGDNLQDRIRFLAERGVTPAKVWVMRMLFPLGYVSSVVLFYALVVSRYQQFDSDKWNPPVWLVFCGMLVVFAYSHWFAQLVRNPILAAIGGPIVASMGIGYIAYAYNELTPMFAYAIALCLAPFVATFLMMRRWMDRRFQWQYWCGHFAILLVAVVAPIVSLAWYVWQAPRMPNYIKLAFLEEAKTMNGQAWYSVSGGIAGVPNVEWNPDGDLQIDKQIEFATKSLDTASRVRILEEIRATGTGFSLYGTSALIGNVILARTRADQSSADPDALKEYCLQIELLAIIAQGLRQSDFLISQEEADLVEIALIGELQLPASKERLGQDTWDQYVKDVSDSAARNRARRKAVVISWIGHNFQKEDWKDYRSSLGGFNISSFQALSNTRMLVTGVGRVDHLAWALLQYLDAGPTASESEKIELLGQRWPDDPNENGTNRMLPNPRWKNDPKFFRRLQNVQILPGERWFGAWEKAGEQLATKPTVNNYEK